MVTACVNRSAQASSEINPDCLAQFNLTPQQALFVGDSSIDVATARAAGVPVWLLPYGYNMGAPVEDCQPDRIIQDFSELLNT